MLVLSRKHQESIVIDGRIRITILDVAGKRVRLGVDAPAEVAIQRSELIRPQEPQTVAMDSGSLQWFESAI